MRRVCLLVSIDTEEDQWAATRSALSTRNLRALPEAQRLLESLGIRCTYFTAWSAATDPWARGFLGELHASGAAEIGGHLHPWNTPPESEPLGGRNTMLANLPAELQAEKLRRLTDRLTELRGSPPVSFRAGRWALGAETARALVDAGYRVDSSVMPHVSWERYDEGPSFLGSPTDVYRLDPAKGVTTVAPDGPLVEVPVSVGFTAPGPQHVWAQLQRAMWRPSRGRAVLAAPLWRSRLLRKVVLTPEAMDVASMLRAARRLIGDGARHLHLFWHSQSHTPGLNPFVATTRARDAFHDRIREVVEGLNRLATLEPMTVTEAAERLS